MKIKRFLRRFNITILCLMAVHMLLPPLIQWFLEATISFDWRWYLQPYVIGFVCEQLYTAATAQELKRVKRMRICFVIFAVCSSVHIQLGGSLTHYIIPLVCIWSVWLWVEARKMDPEKETQNIVNCVLTVIYVLHAATDVQQSYAWYIAYGKNTNLVTLIPSCAHYVLQDYLPWIILINMAFLAVRTYRNLSDD